MQTGVIFVALAMGFSVLKPSLLMRTTHVTNASEPLPERAQRAIWEGRSARRRNAPSTGRGWASTSEILSGDEEGGSKAQKDLYKAGKLQEAYEAYRSAWSLKHTHDIAANLANSESQLGKMRDAAEHLAFCVRYFPPSGSKAQLERLKGHFEEARREVGAVFIQVNVEGAEVFVDGVSIGRVLPTDEIYLDPGTRTIEVKLKGYEPAKQVVKVAKGPTQTVALSLVAVAPPTASTAEPAFTGKPSASGAPVASTAPVPPPPRSVVPGVILGGVGVAALATGIGFVLDAGGKNSSSRDLNSAILSDHHSCVTGASNYDARCGELNDTSLSARANRRVGAGLLVGGGVAAAGAAAYFLWPTKKLDTQSSHALRVVPAVSTRDAGFILSGAF